MKLATMGQSNNVYPYWRCINKGNEQYTNVFCDGLPQHKRWLETEFNEVVLRDMTLPAWRLYQVVD